MASQEAVFWKCHTGIYNNLEVDFDWLLHFGQNTRRYVHVVGVDEAALPMSTFGRLEANLLAIQL